MNKLLAILIGLVPVLSVGQTGPGGIGNATNNGLWLDANNISLNNGDPVPLWNDTSGNGNDAFQVTINNQPSFIEVSSFNTYPSISFDGIQSSANGDWMRVDDADILDGTNSMRYFVVVRPRAISSPEPVQPILGKRTSQNINADYAYTFFFNNRPLFVDIVTQNNRFGTTTNFSSNTNYLVGFGFDGSLPSASRSKIYNGGLTAATGNETSTSIINSNQPLTLGILNLGYNRYFNGEMAEIIYFNRDLNLTESIIVNNYLSAKYNITIDPSLDFYTQDNPANGDFDHDVAGIGRAIGTPFPDGMHLDSQGTGIIRISSPTNISSGAFLFWGRDTKSGIIPSFIPNTFDNDLILDTKWRVSNPSNSVGGNLTFEIDLTGVITLDGCDELELIIDNDSDFSSPKFSEDLTLTGSIATATTNVGFDDGDYFTIVRKNVIIFDGTSWFNGSGSGNIPDMTDSCKDLYILSGPRVDIGNFNVRSINLLTNSRLHVNNDEVAIVEEGIFIDTNARIILRGRSQLLQYHTGPNLNTGDGIIRVRQQGTTNQFNYNFWSSPVNRLGDWQLQYLQNGNGPVLFSAFSERNPSVGDNPLTLSGRWLYTYNGNRDDYNDWNYVGSTGGILPGLGYTMKGSGIGTGSYNYLFDGTPNSGDISIPVTANGSVLIGNPYPSALDIDQFLSDNSANTTATAYFYEQFATNNSHLLIEYEGGYATRNMMMGTPATADMSGLTSGLGTASKPAPNQFIAIAQGFFIDTTTGADVVFNNSQRNFVRENDPTGSVFYRDAGNPNPAFGGDARTKLTLSFTKPNAYIKFIGLGYDARATAGVDNGFDAIDKNEEPDGIRWYLEQKDYIIQTLSSYDFNDILPLSFKIVNAGNYTIAIDNLENAPSGMELFLYDSLNGVEYDLIQGAAIIDLPIMNHVTNRFSIRFKSSVTLSIDSPTMENMVVTYLNQESSLEIINPTFFEIFEAIVFNINGQQICSFLNPETRNPVQLSSGIYIVQLRTKNGLQVGKKILVE